MLDRNISQFQRYGIGMTYKLRNNVFLVTIDMKNFKSQVKTWILLNFFRSLVDAIYIIVRIVSLKISCSLPEQASGLRLAWAMDYSMLYGLGRGLG